MGVRYSGRTIKYSNAIPSSSGAAMVAGIDAVLGPVAAARVSVTGGWKYTLQSPDGLAMKVWIQDLGDHDEFHSYLRVTPTSMDEERTGTIGFLDLNGDTYEAWANCCQFFVAKLGIADTFYNFACGVLSVLPSGGGPCTLTGDVPTVTELWWSSAADNHNGGNSNFRLARYDTGNWALAYNGAFVPTGGLVLGMMPLCEASNVDYAYGTPPSIARYSSGDGLRIDPLIAVGQQIYGQLWDAHLYTLPAALDSAVTLSDTDASGQAMTLDWFAWNNSVPSPPTAGSGTVLGTLFLLMASSTEILVNVAF